MMHLLPDAAATILSAAILQAFTWALTAISSSDKTPTGMKVILSASVTTGWGSLVLLWIGSQPPARSSSAWRSNSARLGLFAAALVGDQEDPVRLAFDDELPDQLVLSGPYNYIRHPFYTSYLIFWTGFALITFSWLALPLLLLMAA